MVNFEIEKTFTGPVVGLDEVGRGPLAGPVISCGCLFTDYDYLQDKLKFIDDSKKITSKKRKVVFNHLLKLIKRNLLIYKLGMATVKEIDEMRAEMRKSGILFKITKNKITKLSTYSRNIILFLCFIFIFGSGYEVLYNFTVWGALMSAEAISGLSLIHI